MSLRQKQIKEVLDYDVFQSRRVFDNTIKQARAMNESNAQPRKSELETETSIQGLCDALVNSIKKLTGMLPLVQSASKISNINDNYELKQYRDNLVEILEANGAQLSNQEINSILFNKNIGDIKSLVHIKLRQKGLDNNQQLKDKVNEFLNNMTAYESKSVDELGLKRLETEKQERKSSQEYDATLAGIVSQYNGIVNLIIQKNRDAGYSKNSINYLISMLKPVVDASKEFLALVSTIRISNTVTYTKSYGIIKKMVDLIEQAPPLVKLDATLLSDRYYVGQVEGEFEHQRVGQYVDNQRTIETNAKKRLEDIKRQGRNIDLPSQFLNYADRQPMQFIGPTGRMEFKTGPKSTVQSKESKIVEKEATKKANKVKKPSTKVEFGEPGVGAVDIKDILSGQERERKVRPTFPRLPASPIESDEEGEMDVISSDDENDGRGKPRRLTGGVWETGIGQDPEEARHISNVLSQRASERWLGSKLYPMGPYPYLPIKADNTMGRLDELQQRVANNLVDENREEEEVEEAPQAPKQVEALQGQNEGKGRTRRSLLGSKGTGKKAGCGNCEGGKKKKKGEVKMSKKAFTKEHKKLIGMLSKTSGTLGAEAREQLGEMKRVAPEDALQVEKTIKHTQKKKELKGGKKKEKKQTGTLQFDEKLNDVWFM